MVTLTMLLGVRLVKLGLKDTRRIAQLANNYNIWINVRDKFPHPYSEHNAIEFIRAIQHEDPQLTFGIEYEGEICGVIGLSLQKDVYKHSAEIGYWLAEPYWNKGITTSAVQKIMIYTSDTLKIKRLFANVYEYNAASMSVLEKCGFKKEGIRKKAVLKDGKYIDDVLYGYVFE